MSPIPDSAVGRELGFSSRGSADGLFRGQKSDFFDFLNELAEAADCARRED
jgi:hypothetical protein